MIASVATYAAGLLAQAVSYGAETHAAISKKAQRSHGVEQRFDLRDCHGALPVARIKPARNNQNKI